MPRSWPASPTSPPRAARRCRNCLATGFTWSCSATALRPRTEKPILPRFSVGDRAVDEGAELRTRAEAGLERRVAAYGLAPGRTIEEYRERLAFELQVIEGMKYPGYFLIVSDFIQWAK